jgi:predicted enzyme related to lactoylglutathione lyase
MSTSTLTNPIGYTELHTKDHARARAFYSELFGWKAEEERTPLGPYTMFQDLSVGILGNSGDTPATWVPYVSVADLAQSTRRARELGAQVLHDSVAIPQGTFSIVRDPTGAVLGLWQKK